MALAGIVVTVGCGSGADTESGSGATHTLTIGAVLSLSGPLSSLGQAQKNGLQLALRDYNARHPRPDLKIKIKYADDRNSIVLRREAQGGLVHERHPWPCHQRSRDGQLLLLTSGQCGRQLRPPLEQHREPLVRLLEFLAHH